MDTPVTERSAVVDIPTTPGVSWGGGIYMGRAVIGLAVFAIVLAPKSEGEFVDRQWHDQEDKVEGALSYFDGLANTDAMVAAGSQLAKDVRDLRIGGYDDWFLPSRQDALVIMGNLAAAGDEAFGKGGNQEFDRNSSYWTSTQIASHPVYAWVQVFGNGLQPTRWKSNITRARAVRRVAI